MGLEKEEVERGGGWREWWVSGYAGAATRIVFGAMDDGDGRWAMDDGRWIWTRTRTWIMVLFGEALPSFATGNARHVLVRMGIGGRRHHDTSSWVPCRLADRCALASAGGWTNGAACAGVKGWV